MTEDRKLIPEIAENKLLTDAQLSEVAGGETDIILVHPMAFKRCAADPTHVYVEVLDACPVCGSKEFTRA